MPWLREGDSFLLGFGNEHLSDKVDVIICDSPLLISIVYDKENSKALHELIMEQFNKFNNLNFYIKRSSIYQESGRRQTEEEAKELDKIVKKVLIDYSIPHTDIDIDGAAQMITDTVVDLLKKQQENK